MNHVQEQEGNLGRVHPHLSLIPRPHGNEAMAHISALSLLRGWPWEQQLLGNFQLSAISGLLAPPLCDLLTQRAKVQHNGYKPG